MSHRLRLIIQQAVDANKPDTLALRLYTAIAKDFSEIKSEALQEILGRCKEDLAAAKTELEHRQTVIHTFERDLRDANEHVLSCFSQGAHVRTDIKKDIWVYDHMCLSAYESAQDYLIEKGLIKKEECVRK